MSQMEESDEALRRLIFRAMVDRLFSGYCYCKAYSAGRC